jgi:hypothetical protein
MTHLDIWNTSYDKKKSREPNWQFYSWAVQVRNRPDSLVCRQHATYCWKALDKGYNFASDLITIGGLHVKLCAPKVTGVRVVGISGFSLGSHKTKCHLDVAFVESCREYYKGEGGGFPQVRAIVSLVSLVSSRLPVARPNTKSVQTMHEPTFVFGFCRFAWLNSCLSFFLIPSRSSNMPLYPRNVTNQGTCLGSLFFCCFHFGLSFESIKKLGSTSHFL